MIPNDELQVSENSEASRLAAIGAKVEFCMENYQPYLRQDFNLGQLSVITNIPVSNLEIYFNQSSIPSFNQYLDKWRINHAKNLMSSGKVRGMEWKTIGSLSGFSSVKKFTEAFKHIEGILPEIDQ